MIARRSFLLGTGALALAGCGGKPPGPTTVALSFTGGAGMNPGPDGSDRPVTVSVLRLKDLGAFSGADYFALSGDPAAALGGALVGMSQVAVPPGGTAALDVAFEPEAAFLGLVALVRDPNGKVWRASAPVVPHKAATGKVTLSPGGVSLALT